MIRTIVQVDGMMCGMCEAHINDAIRKHFKVKKVTASRSKGEAVILSEEPLDEADLTEVIRAVALARGSSPEEVEEIRRKKAEKRGGFVSRILLEEVTEL